MNFALIGNVRTYAQMKNLKFAANYRMKTGQSLVRPNGTLNFNFAAQERSSFVDQMMKSKQSGDEVSRKRLAAIKRKLMSGKKLSNEEMGFLLKNDSKLYNKAKKVEEAREELKSALSQAKTKEDARKAVLHAKMKASAICSMELDAAKQAGGAMSSGGAVAVGGYEASGDVGGLIAPSPSGAENVSSPENVSQTENNFSVPIPSVQSNSDQIGAEQKFFDPKANGINGAQSKEEKDTPEDILEKYIMIIRALEDEWRTFSKSKQYRDLPEGDENSSLIDWRKDEVISKYRAAMVAKN